VVNTVSGTCASNVTFTATVTDNGPAQATCACRLAATPSRRVYVRDVRGR
jgi:hypothetical protein